MSTIIWTKIDEAPALATYSLLPIVNAFTKSAGVDVELRDISLAGRVLSTFPENLTLAQKIDDELAYLGTVVQKADGNIIKLPNISASVPQLQDCISELQGQGYDIPNFPEDPQNDEEKAIKEKYSTCLGSAVNPVLREGNSDRRAAVAVKKFAQKNPHKLRAFESPSKAYVAHMNGGDFFSNEKSVIKSGAGSVTIELNGKCLKKLDDIQDKEVLDATFMSKTALRSFLQDTLDEAKKNDVLWSLHMKATMMKVSDPIIFGHAVEVFFKDVFAKYSDEFNAIGYNSNMGLGDLYKKLEKSSKKDEIIAAIEAVYATQPNMAMVDSDKGITNLHASNDIIIDASMPVVIRDGGKMWNAAGKVQECVSVIPDASYAVFHKAMVDDCVANGQYDVTTMGNVANVGLMAQKAEEYGSHPTTFEVSEAGTMEVKDENGKVLMSHNVEEGDIWRLSRTKDIPIQDWVRLAVERGRLTGSPVVFWLNEKRAHDANIITKVDEYIKSHDTSGLEILTMDVASATKYSNARMREGKDTIAATGNVLRDHLTDMYPILELGTSAKMLSIVPLIAGGGLFETGAGGSAPKHVDQFLEEGHLRWDSLGEFLALAESLRFIALKNSSKDLEVVTAALDAANQAYLDNNKSPSRKCGEPDNKASHFFVAQYWADALASQSDDKALAEKFAPVAAALKDNEAKIIEELLAVEGKAQDVGGYFHPDDAKAEKAMRPSATLNSIIDAI
jgi:isocitrate dehydrogenase